MKRSILPALLLLVAAFATGCGSNDNPKTAGDKLAGATASVPAQAPEKTGLSAEDQKLADAQGNCPVSGKPLGGAMGAPVKIAAGGHTVFLCCPMCIRKLKRDPEKYMAILKNRENEK